MRAEVAEVNASAAASLEEGLEETLTLHRLGLFKELGRSFKTTNCMENLNALIGQRTDKVDNWRNADQKHRWLAIPMYIGRHRTASTEGVRLWRAAPPACGLAGCVRGKSSASCVDPGAVRNLNYDWH